METSKDITKIAAALSAAQEEGLVAVKDRTNDHLKSAYADLVAVWEAVRPVLAKQKLALSQWPGAIRHAEGCAIIGLTNVLTHGESGQWMRETMEVPLPEAIVSRGGGNVINLAQRMGSALSYARRYGMLAVLGIATGDDDDAQRAFGQPRTAPRDDAPAAPTGRPWQELYDSGEWKDHGEPDGILNLGQCSPAELWKYCIANKANGFANPYLVAASAFCLDSQSRNRGLTVRQALEAAKWPGATDVSQMTPADIFLATKAVAALPQKKEEEAKA